MDRRIPVSSNPALPGPQARPAPWHERLSGKPARPDDSAAAPDGPAHSVHERSRDPSAGSNHIQKSALLLSNSRLRSFVLRVLCASAVIFVIVRL